MNELSRRHLLRCFLGAPALAWACRSRPVQRVVTDMDGELVLRSDHFGHRFRDLTEFPAPTSHRQAEVVVVGAGLSGLGAAWRLAGAGVGDVLVVDLDARVGGTAQSDRSAVTAFPWGAHYVTAPMAEHRAMIRLLSEMDVLDGFDALGHPIVAEQHLCRDPSERVFYRGRWYEGLVPGVAASDGDRAQLERFRQLMGRYAALRDDHGRRAFALPISQCSSEVGAELRALDGISMAEWLRRESFDSPLLSWWVDYACRDDYGAQAADVSAWAGLHYFTARKGTDDGEYQDVVTWPQGNGRIVEHLAHKLGSRLLLGHAVLSAQTEADGVEVLALREDGTALSIRARHAILATPQFITRRIVRDLSDERRAVADSFTHGPWMVANVHLPERPVGLGFPLAWDNVLYDSPSLGYVVANHQTGPESGPTVLTYYYPITDTDARAGRTRLLSLDWEHWAEVVVSDLDRAHPGLRALVQRIDVARWGHAMVRPAPGLAWGRARAEAQLPHGRIHFAHSDLSGLALCEEALDQGLRAAEEILRARADALTPSSALESWR